MNDLLLRALRCEETLRPPVWFKRQAGRFLPSYQRLRRSHSLHHLFHTPSLASEITCLPCDELGVDAAILFSDILVIAEVLGYHVDFPLSGGVKVTPPAIKQEGDVRDVLSYVFETIRLLKPKLSVPLIGFCGGPYTVATYLKDTTPQMLQKLTDLSIIYLKEQVLAGVDAIEIFDSWAGHLERSDFEQKSLPYLQQMVEALRPLQIPVIVFCRGSCRYIPELVALNPRAISFDWEEPIDILRQKVPPHLAIQGNLDPEIFAGPLEPLMEKVSQILTSMKGKRGYIFNLGHGVLPRTPVENAHAVIEIVKKISVDSPLST